MDLSEAGACCCGGNAEVPAMPKGSRRVHVSEVCLESRARRGADHGNANNDVSSAVPPALAIPFVKVVASLESIYLDTQHAYLDHYYLRPMGNAPLKIVISTDRQSYSPGSTVSGRTYVAVNQQGVQASSLNLQLIGEEISIVAYSEGSNDRDGERRTHRDKSTNKLLDLDFPVATFANGILMPGHYEFPFQITLPSDLPATMVCRHGESKCEIRYQMSAYLNRPGLEAAAIRPLRIVGTLRTSSENMRQPIVLPTDTQPVNHCCCINKGSMSLQTEVDKDVMSPGDQTNVVTFRCKNESTVKVSGVKIMLTEKVLWSAMSRKEESRRILYQVFLPGVDFPELDRLHRLPHFSQHRGSGGYDPIVGQASHQSSLIVPVDARESYNGTLIEVRHLLTVTLQTRCCISSPESCVYLRVQQRPDFPDTYTASTPNQALPTPSAPPLESEYIPEAEVLPADWSAEVADVVNIPMAHAVLIDEGGAIGSEAKARPIV